MEQPYRCKDTVDIEELTETLRTALEKSMFTLSGAAKHYEVPVSTISAWVRETSRPNNTNKERHSRIMRDLLKNPAKKKHPSYGWATPEQIKRLETLPPGPDKKLLLAEIAKQNKKKGKV